MYELMVFMFILVDNNPACLVFIKPIILRVSNYSN